MLQLSAKANLDVHVVKQGKSVFSTRCRGGCGPGRIPPQPDQLNGDNRRDVIATVFEGVDNRMKSGYLLRDVINKINGIHFTSSEELHTLGALYESMLREMRDAAGDAEEFYTPRAVVRFMVTVTNPRLGETVLERRAGRAGFSWNRSLTSASRSRR